MQQFKSLAEALGTLPPAAGEPEAPRLVDITDAKSFAEAVLTSPEFRQFVVNGLTLGEIAPAILLRLMDYAWGKPVERVEVKDTSDDVATMTPEQLEQRAATLRDMARLMRRAEQFDEPLASDSVH